MNPDFWRERWENREIGFHRDAAHPYLTRFWPTLGIAPGSRVFVPLCGKSNDLLWLRPFGGVPEQQTARAESVHGETSAIAIAQVTRAAAGH